MGTPSGFTFQGRSDQTVAIYHHGKLATVLRGAKAARFREEVDRGDAETRQLAMARLTGTYKRGNERGAAAHHRNSSAS